MGQRLPPQKSVVQYETADPMVSAVKQRNSERNQLDREFYYSKGGIHHKTNGDHNIKLEKDGNDGKDNNDGETNLIVVLDLDECLIHSKFLNSTDVFRQYESDRERHNTGFHNSPRKNLNSTCETFHLTLPDGELVHVHKRPNLDTFLEHVTSRYDTYIFTAAMQVYASPLLDILDPENTRFKKRFYREHCKYDPNVNAYVKDLSHVSNHISSFSNVPLDINPARRMVLVDNNPMSFIANPQNGILVSNFYDDYSDDTLSAVIDLLEELEDVDDVRPFLDEKFGLQAALSEVMNGYYWNQREDVIAAMELEESHANDNEEEEDVKRQ
jgi:CTD small phosphatase-like protein 2